MNTTFTKISIGTKFTFEDVKPGDVGKTFIKYGKISAKVIRQDGLETKPFRVYAAKKVVSQ